MYILTYTYIYPGNPKDILKTVVPVKDVFYKGHFHQTKHISMNLGFCHSRASLGFHPLLFAALIALAKSALKKPQGPTYGKIHTWAHVRRTRLEC